MRRSKVAKLVDMSSAPDPAITEPGEHSVGAVVPIPKGEKKNLGDQFKLVRELLLSLGEHDFAVAVAEARRNQIRAEYQKAQETYVASMRVAAKIAGIDVEGPGQWDANTETMTFTRRALPRG